MLKIETTQTLEKKLVPDSKFPFADLIAESLKSLGFIHIKQERTSITFKSNFKDTRLESFQRRYGNGVLHFSDRDDHLSIRTTYNYTRSLVITVVGDLTVFTAMNYHFIFQSKESLLFILIFNFVLVSVSIFSFWTSQRRYKSKQKKLLNLLIAEIKQPATK